MNTHKLASLHYVIRAIILFAFAMLIVRLVQTESILLYIAPRMVDFVKWSAVGLYAAAVYQIYLAFTHYRVKADSCGCSHLPSGSLLRNIAIYGLFVFPLLLGFLLPNSTMGSSLAAKKGMNLNSSASVRTAAPSDDLQAAAPLAEDPLPEKVTEPEDEDPKTSSANAPDDAELLAMFNPDPFTEIYARHAVELYQEDLIRIDENIYIESLTTVDLYLDHFVGKKLEIIGFVYREDFMKENQFVVGRFAVQCCSADAAPYGIFAEYEDAKQYAEDTWIKATGTISKTQLHDMDIMKLDITAVEKIAAPENPYVYPNYDFGLTPAEPGNEAIPDSL